MAECDSVDLAGASPHVLTSVPVHRSSLSLSLPPTPKAGEINDPRTIAHEHRGQLSGRLSQSSSPPRMRLSEAEVLTSLHERSFGTGLVGTPGHARLSGSGSNEPRHYKQSTLASRLRTAFTGRSTRVRDRELRVVSSNDKTV